MGIEFRGAGVIHDPSRLKVFAAYILLRLRINQPDLVEGKDDFF